MLLPSAGYWASLHVPLLYTLELALAEQFLAALKKGVAEHGFAIYNPPCQGWQGVILVARGDNAGLPLLRNALTQLEELGLRTRYYPIYLGSLAQGLGAAGHLTEAYSAIDTALAWINKHEEYWCSAELLRIKGELFRLEGSAAAAEDHYRQALEWARRQNALSWELRAATSLAQLWHQNGRAEEAEKLLSSVYTRFSEGFETADLMSARVLIGNCRNSLSGDRGPLRRARRLS